jgi:ABC-type glycerol-3-phosphate transport system substrate-binding protein
MFRRFCLAVALALGAAPAWAQQLTIWHDLGDNGAKWFAAMAEAFAKTHPGVTLRATNYPTDQWFGRSIAALNTDTAPDLIFNNYERVIRVAAQTGKVMDLKPVMESIADKAFLGEDDLRVATYAGHMIILPVQRVQMGFGVRKSWLDKVGETFPATWEDAKRVATKFGTLHPDGNPNAVVFGFGLEAANPRDLIHMLDLFTFGAGLKHTLIDPAGNIVIDEPRHAQVLEEFLKTYTTYHFVAPDTVNYSFNEMYQVIEGGKAGMFRVGDWNVGKWDNQAIKGDFLVGPWPRFFPDLQNGVVIGGMRGVAVPENAPNKKLAIAFATFMLGKEAQQMSLAMMGAAVRKDLDVASLSPRQQFFAAPKGALYAYDFPESVILYYPELEAAFHRKLMGAIAKPPADWKAFIAETAAEMRALSKTLAAKKG